MKANRGQGKPKQGWLMERTENAVKRALESGALKPIRTKSTFVKDSGVDFLVRIVSSLEQKEEDRKAKKDEYEAPGGSFNPFLPYDERMFVADISETHVCLLNKYNVIDHHLLMVTRFFESQESLLTLRDFEAAQWCLARLDGLAFYNGGVIAGASQAHKHLQMVPLPMADKGPGVPVEPLLEDARSDGEPGAVPGFPFINVFVRFGEDPGRSRPRSAEEFFETYRALMQQAGLNRADEPEDAEQTGPYNLLFTREWMLLVPRSREFFDTISINALAFAGALLVRNQEEMRMIRKHGGLAVLRHTAFSP